MTDILQKDLIVRVRNADLKNKTITLIATRISKEPFILPPTQMDFFLQLHLSTETIALRSY